ncbi:DNA polymerase III subunit gamma/tau [Pleomorphochaeta sp. DL1XJH-081]|uniref:DNA polymerase III subunit gamma/tau n=1 Tax=Pleomorphochaeta sp. DL1XJH-081 TaxID=3409690 RepID=UPI003BB5A2F5
MAYEVTATRKRPQLFDGLVGQQFVVSTIKNAIEQGRTAHAYLFSGPRGVGKTSSARILAKALNCEQGPTPYPCGVCSHCIEITQGNCPDVIEIDGASNTSVNDVRIIKDEVLFPPQSSRYKVYIIDEVHMLSTSAFNALLKTIEEPPEYVVFIFATTETQKVPATIRSRCQQFHFQLIPLEAIKDVLTETANEMGIEADDDALFWIAKESTGSMRDAYTLFDQVVSFSNGSITLEKIQQKLGLAGLDKISAIVGSLLEDRTDTSLLALHTLLDSGVSVEQCIKDLAEYMRTLLLIKRGVLNESILGVQVSQIPSIVRDAYTEEQLEAAFELFLKLYRDIRFSLNPRFELELAISRLSHLRRMASSVVLVRKIEDLKESLMNTELRVGAVQKAATVVVQTAMPQPPVVTTREKDVVAEPEQTEKTIVKDKPIEQPPKEEVKQYKKITMERLPELIQEMAAERDPAGIVLSQVVAVNHTEELLSFIFASKYAMESAKQNEETLRKLVARHTGYDGPLQFSKEETNPAQTSTPKMKTDEIANTIATMFRGEVLHLQ